MKWNNKTIYQVYPMSFLDSTGNGTGDILGIISKINYLKYLGVDYLWLSPVTCSPMIDNGYDVSDYKNINKLFGTNDDYDNLIIEANKSGINIVMDMIMNHTSNEHEWFKKSVDRVEPYTDYYVWRDEPVGNFGSQFEDDAWTYSEKRGQYYLHHFAVEQPDLNWENEKILFEFIEIINFWIDKGVKGFRFDVIDMIGKQIDLGKTINLDRAFNNIRKLGNETWLKHDDIFTVGEAWSTNRTTGAKYSGKDGGVFTTLFNLRHVFIGWDNDDRWHPNVIEGKYFDKFKKFLFETHAKLDKISNVPLFMENHDFPRSISRLLGDDGDTTKKGKVIAASIYGYGGINVIYQGQEFGQLNGVFKDENEFNDPETKKYMRNSKDSDTLKYASLGSRDNARIPLRWNSSGGFTTGKPWLPIHESGESIEGALKDNDSLLHFYKNLIAFKEKHKTIIEDGELKSTNWSNHESVISYKYVNGDNEYIVIVNWGNDEIEINREDSDIFYSDVDNNLLKSLGIYIAKK